MEALFTVDMNRIYEQQIKGQIVNKFNLTTVDVNNMMYHCLGPHIVYILASDRQLKADNAAWINLA